MKTFLINLDKFRKIQRKFFFVLLRKPLLPLRLLALKKLGYKLGRDVYVGDGITLTVGVADESIVFELEDRVSVAPNVTFVLASHANNSVLHPYFGNPRRRIIVRHDSWIGAGAIILPDVEIGECSVVAAGSVVLHDVPPYTIVAGNPAKVIKEIDKSKLSAK